MRIKSKTALYAPVLIAMLVCALAFATGVLGKYRVYPDMVHMSMSFPGGRWPNFSLQEGDTYGVMQSEGPGMTLPAGDYELRWQVTGDGDNAMHLSGTNGVAVEPSTVVLPAGQNEGRVKLTLEDICESFTIGFEFASGTYMDVGEIRLYTPEYSDNAFTLLFCAVFLSTLWLLYGYGRLTRENAGVLIFVGLAVLLASSTAMKETVNKGHDIDFHMARLENLVSGLRSGQFPVRMGGYTYNGYGAVTSVFYPDFFLYPLALMRMGGASITYVANVMMIAVSIATAISMYVSARHLFGGRWEAACAAILYTLCTYRISDMYTRFAVGEMTAMVLLPLFVWGLWEVVRGDKARWKVLALSATGIFLCHMVSTLICGVLAVLFCLVNIRKIVTQGRLLPLLKAVGLCVGLCAFQIVPFITYSLQGIGAGELAYDITNYTVEPAQLLMLGEGNVLVPANTKLLHFAVEIGLPQLVGAALALYMVIQAPRRGQTERAVLFFVAAGTLLAIAATDFFPWGVMRVLTNDLVGYLQFSWRLVMPVVLLFALAGGYGIARFAGARQDAAAVLTLCLAALCALPTLSRETRYDEYVGFAESTNSSIHYSEYTLPGTQVTDTKDRTAHVEGEVTMTDYEKRETNVRATVSAQTDAVISLPLFGFDGFRAQVGGQEMEVGLGENNRLTVHLPAGTSGALRVWFAGKGIWRVADAVSLLTLAALVAGAARRRGRERRAKESPNR